MRRRREAVECTNTIQKTRLEKSESFSKLLPDEE
jgi:hypothetical protein